MTVKVIWLIILNPLIFSRLFSDLIVIVKAMKRLIEGKCGQQVTSFLSPKEAVAFLDANPERFSICMVDLFMPELDGTDVARHIRELEKKV